MGDGGDLRCLAQIVEPHRLTARLGGCGLQGANAGVIAAIGHGLLQLLWGMGAAADQAIRTEQTPRLRWRQIPLAQMHPIGLHRQSQIHPVVHDEQGTMGSAEIPQRHGFLVAGQIVGELAAVLHQLHPRLQGLLHHRAQLRHRAGDQIQPLGRQPLAAA